MRHSRITSCKKKELIRIEESFFVLSICAEIVALRATLSSGAPRHLPSKEGFRRCRLRRIYFMPAEPASERSERLQKWVGHELGGLPVLCRAQRERAERAIITGIVAAGDTS